MGDYEQELYRFFDSRKPAILRAIADKKALDDGLKAEMGAALKEFGDTFLAGKTSAAA